MNKTGINPDYWWNLEDDVGINGGMVPLMQRFAADSHDLIRGIRRNEPVTHPCGELQRLGFWAHILSVTDGYARTIGKNSWMSLEFIERKSRKLANRIADWYRLGKVANSKVFSISWNYCFSHYALIIVC